MRSKSVKRKSKGALGADANYLLNRRRMIAARPTRPVPRAIKTPGSGIAEARMAVGAAKQFTAAKETRKRAKNMLRTRDILLSLKESQMGCQTAVNSRVVHN